MKTYPIPMIPGPVSVPADVLAAYQTDFGSGDLEPEFLELYNRTEANLQAILGTRNSVAIQTGEGMLALWSALKSCIRPGERVLALATGVFGYGIGDMARSIGAEVRTLGLPYDETFHDWDAVEEAIAAFKPKMITVVHCETPSGTLNPLAELGALKRTHHVPLLYIDSVAALGGVPLETDAWGIDLLLGGSQKALSVPPGMSFVAISPAAWEIIAEVSYVGYDALLPFRTAQQDFYFPYTPYWHGMAALNAGAERILAEGLEACFARHERAAQRCRAGIIELGLELFPALGAVPSPTVTAVKVPEAIDWTELDARFRKAGLAVGGSYGPLAGKVFRLGHMGTQADVALVERALAVIAGAI
ncbi:MAG: alanine--glyoxylate aminotransferase family protein [Anaerolineaceae bacterium]|nr:alanine--glyoxylate aminotransferase family protein [Anaerolineaceae bacterium]